MQVIRAQAAHVRAPLVVWGEDYESFEQGGRLVYQDGARLLDLALPALLGQHQIDNAGVAVAAALQLQVLQIPESAIERGLLEVQWPARMQRLASGPLTRLLTTPSSELWLDGGHNVAGAAAVAQTLGELEERAPKPLVIVLGMMGQKDAKGFLEHFRGLARRIVTVAIPGAHEKPFDPAELSAVAASLGFDSAPASSLEAALIAAQAGFNTPMRILICGSLYLAGHVLAQQAGVTAQGN
jgi:dihydrofolate synthase/folylpolyglutamate synthase